MDDFNLRSKIQMGLKLLSGEIEADYPGGYDAFLEEFNVSIADRRRFIYAPLLCCRGRKQSKL